MHSAKGVILADKVAILRSAYENTASRSHLGRDTFFYQVYTHAFIYRESVQNIPNK